MFININMVEVEVNFIKLIKEQKLNIFNKKKD